MKQKNRSENLNGEFRDLSDREIDSVAGGFGLPGAVLGAVVGAFSGAVNGGGFSGAAKGALFGAALGVTGGLTLATRGMAQAAWGARTAGLTAASDAIGLRVSTQQS